MKSKALTTFGVVNFLTVLGRFLVLYWFLCLLVVLNRVNRWEFAK